MDKLKEAIKSKVNDNNKISCKDAFKIAEEQGLSVGEVGKVINEMSIKISGCQLGCF